MRRLCSLVFALLALVAPLRAQTIRGVQAVTGSGTLTALNANCVAASCVSVELGGFKTISVQTVGTCGTCTVQFEASDDVVGTWVAVNMLPLSGTQTAVTSVSTAGIWNGTVNAARFRARMSALSSGNFLVTVRATF